MLRPVVRSREGCAESRSGPPSCESAWGPRLRPGPLPLAPAASHIVQAPLLSPQAASGALGGGLQWPVSLLACGCLHVTGGPEQSRPWNTGGLPPGGPPAVRLGLDLEPISEGPGSHPSPNRTCPLSGRNQQDPTRSEGGTPPVRALLQLSVDSLWARK